jgi:hypothetical protein
MPQNNETNQTSLKAREDAHYKDKIINAMTKEIEDAEHKNSSPSVLAKWILIALDEAGFKIVRKDNVQ